MPRLDTFDITIVTGERGRTTRPTWVINSFEVEFDDAEGGTGSGETFKATGNPGSFPHSLVLRGPESGPWDIANATVTYYPTGEDPYTIRLGAVTVDDDADLNIWYDRLLPSFDV
jgi:hypothetical protein